MIVTKKYINDLREKSFLDIPDDIENLILNKFGENSSSDAYEYTEQDIYEQIRKLLDTRENTWFSHLNCIYFIILEMKIS